MDNKKLILHGFLHSVMAFLYIAGVATLLVSVPKLMGPMKLAPGLGATAFLLLFVISAAIMGLIVLGRPVMLYLDGKKKEGIQLLFYIIGFLVVIAMVFFLVLVAIGGSVGRPV